MKINFDKYVADPKLEEDGVWLEFDGLRCRIARTDSKKYNRAMERHKKAIGAHLVAKSPDLANKVVRLAMADATFLEFEGEVEIAGKVYTNSNENRYELLTILKDLFYWVINQSNEIANFQNEAHAEEAETLKSGAPVEP